MSDTPAPLTMADASALHARTQPDAIAFRCDDDVLTYAQFDRHATRVARGLRAAGVRPGDRVAYLGKNSNVCMEVAVGTVRAGAIFTPLNWRLAPPELAFMLQDSAVALIVVDAAFVPTLEAIASGLPALAHRICVDAPSPPQGWSSYPSWRDTPRAPAPAPAARPGDVALQIYTSGTTGRPKGVMLSHRNVRSLPGLEAPDDWPDWNRWTPADVSLVTSPLFHVGGIGWTLRGFFRGSTQVLLREFSARGVLDAIARHRVTRLALVPSAMRMVLELPEVADTDVSSLAYVYYGTSPIALDLLREAMRVFGCRFVQSYGQTETASAIVALAPDDHTLDDVEHMRSAGKALPGVTLEIRNAAGRSLPPGSVGEIVTRSSANMVGYANLPEQTANTLDAQGWLRTGDAGYLDAQGYLYVKDRIQEMIITGGENVYPAEVENALYGHPAIAEVAVIGVPSVRWGQAVKAIVVLRPGHAVSQDDLIAWARQRIGGYKLPKSVDVVDALPRNSTGKVLKADLRRRYAQVP